MVLLKYLVRALASYAGGPDFDPVRFFLCIHPAVKWVHDSLYELKKVKGKEGEGLPHPIKQPWPSKSGVSAPTDPTIITY